MALGTSGGSMSALYVIAEAGSNHLGKPSYAMDLVRIAKDAGADAVKFQAFRYHEVWDDGRCKGAAWEEGWFAAAIEAAKAHGLDFMCTPFDVSWVPVLDPYVARWKVSATHIGDEYLLDACRKTGKDVFASTAFLRPEAIFGYAYTRGFIPLHCVHAYPASLESYAMDEFCHRAGLQRWGISDHAVGFAASACAVARGASVVEKHFKLAKQPRSADDGPHALTPPELTAFVGLLRDVEACRDGDLAPPRRREGLKVYLPEDGGW